MISSNFLTWNVFCLNGQIPLMIQPPKLETPRIEILAALLLFDHFHSFEISKNVEILKFTSNWDKMS